MYSWERPENRGVLWFNLIASMTTIPYSYRSKQSWLLWIERLDDAHSLKWLAEIVGLRFLAVDTGLKHAFFCFIQISSTKLIHLASMENRTQQLFGRWTHSEIHRNKLAAWPCKNRNHTWFVLQMNTSNRAKQPLVEHGDTVEPKALADPF